MEVSIQKKTIEKIFNGVNMKSNEKLLCLVCLVYTRKYGNLWSKWIETRFKMLYRKTFKKQFVMIILSIALLVTFLQKIGLLNTSSHHPKARFYVARVLGNDLPPLHGENQTFLNTELILSQEMPPENFQRIWILSCIIDKTKEREILNLLKAKGELTQVIPLSKKMDLSTLKTDVFDVNRARNSVLVSAFEAGAEWVILLDGSTFLTNESFNSFRTIIENRKKTLFNFIPMVRLQYKMNITKDSTYAYLFPFVSGLQESHIGISRNYYNGWIEKHLNRTSLTTSNILFDEKETSSNN